MDRATEVAGTETRPPEVEAAPDGRAAAPVAPPARQRELGHAPRPIPQLYRPVLLAALLVLLALLFRELVTLLLAVLITVILAIPLSAAATWLERLRVPRPIGAILGLLLGAIVLGGILALILPPLASQVDDLVAALPAVGDDLSELVSDITGGSPNEFGTNLQHSVQSFLESPDQLVGPLASVGLGVAGVVGALILIVVTAVLIASRPDPLLEGAVRLLPPHYRRIGERVMVRLREAWVGWLKGVLVDMAVTAVLLYAGLAIVGLEFALVFAVLSALLVVIPYFGSVLGGIPPVLFALTESPTKALLVLLVYLAVQQIEGNVIVPLVMSRAVKLHAAVVAVGVVIVGQLFGVLGLFVAVPILSTVTIVVQEVWVRPLERDAPATEGRGHVSRPSRVGNDN